MTHSPVQTIGSAALHSLVYSSRSTSAFTEAQLPDLLVRARAHNAAAGVTGMLLYRQGRFIQFLEGADRDVHALFTAIHADPRHESVRVLLDEPIEQRQFQDWTMGYEPSAESAAPAPAGFRDTFDDLESAPDHFVTSRAARELTLWFRVRSARGRLTAA
ncbi:BLUF domain-containing protein [Leucobacter musarum]|uniref:BLUF domain-containing protein n=1 Tax=Leucobacter musarum TaxID=1930747 RepID=UPI0006A786B5|nr:BLUF domain-containing protein [Leucobacter musarum]